MATRMQQRRGTAADWAAQNPVLADGELGFEIDTKVIKVGDGVTPWNSLTTPYLTAGGGTITGELFLPQPTHPSHAARLADVEAQPSGADRVAKSGDTMTGRLDISNSTLGNHLRAIRDANNADFTLGASRAELRFNGSTFMHSTATLITATRDLTVQGIINSSNPRVFIQSGDPGSAAKANDLWGW
jgi:hypothetical protein